VSKKREEEDESKYGKEKGGTEKNTEWNEKTSNTFNM
jgi:hypothetical protein